MTIRTEFNEGDKAFTIDTDTLKVTSFDVKRITTYTVEGKTIVTLYDGDSYTAKGYDEKKCFRSEVELLTHITTKDVAEAV